jgi:hypothetical protein
MQNAHPQKPPTQNPLSQRCVIILNQQLPPGKAANAAAVLALTLGQRHPHLVGEPLVDATGHSYPGLIQIGISVLAGQADALSALLRAAEEQSLDAIIFPHEGQQTVDYAAFRTQIAGQSTEAFELIGLAIAGDKKLVRKLTANLALY